MSRVELKPLGNQLIKSSGHTRLLSHTNSIRHLVTRRVKALEKWQGLAQSNRICKIRKCIELKTQTTKVQGRQRIEHCLPLCMAMEAGMQALDKFLLWLQAHTLPPCKTRHGEG